MNMPWFGEYKVAPDEPDPEDEDYTDKQKKYSKAYDEWKSVVDTIIQQRKEFTEEVPNEEYPMNSIRKFVAFVQQGNVPDEDTIDQIFNPPPPRVGAL